MDQKLLVEYIAIEEEFKAIEERKKTLRDKILKDLQESQMDKVESEVFGSFTVVPKTTWKYSPAVAKIEERLKIAKIKEQDKGTAKATVSHYLLYTPIKND